MSNILTNTSSLQAILEALQNKAAGDGNSESNLPILTNEGSASDMLYGKQLINSDGNIITGTIETFDGSYECSGESGGGIETCTLTVRDYLTQLQIGYECDQEIIYTNGAGDLIIDSIPLVEIQDDILEVDPIVLSFTVAKGSMVYVTYGADSFDENIVRLGTFHEFNYLFQVFRIVDDATITVG